MVYSKIPELHFPVDAKGRTYLVQDVTYYSKAALYDSVKRWRDGGPACSGRFDEKGAWKSTLTTQTTRYDQDGKTMKDVERVFDTKVFEGNVWGLQWFRSDISSNGFISRSTSSMRDRIASPLRRAGFPTRPGCMSIEFPRAGRGAPTLRRPPAPGAVPAPGPAHSRSSSPTDRW